MHGLVHPEGGHIRVAKLPEDLDFPGVCSYHGDCLEVFANFYRRDCVPTYPSQRDLV